MSALKAQLQRLQERVRVPGGRSQAEEVALHQQMADAELAARRCGELAAAGERFIFDARARVIKYRDGRVEVPPRSVPPHVLACRAQT